MNRFLFTITSILLLLISFNSFGQRTYTSTRDTARQKYIPKKLDIIHFEQNEVAADEDEGTDSEEDILYASFDTNAIHYPKFDFSNKLDTTIIPLVAKRRYANGFISPSKGIVTSHFGPRRKRYHYGIDIDLNTGDPVVSAFDGTVRIAKNNRTYGNLVVVRHDNGLETFYAHLSARSVVPEQKVKAGTLLGLGGNTGRSRGSHLHFEIRYLGAAVNPEDVIDFRNHRLLNDTLFLTKENFKHQSKYSSENQYQIAARNKKGNAKSYAQAKRTTSNAKYAATSKKGSNTRNYTVKKGDTLGAIARKKGVSVQKLCKLNGIKPNQTIRPGKTLKTR